MASERGATPGKRKLLQESHEAAHTLIGKFASGTLRVAAASFLRQLVRQELNSSQDVKSVQIGRADLDEVYDATSTLGHEWANQIMSPFDNDISLIGSDEYFIAQEYARIIRAIVAQAGFLEHRNGEITTDLGAAAGSEPLSEEDLESEDIVEECNISEQRKMERLISDPCSLRQSNQERSVTASSSSNNKHKRRRSTDTDSDKSSNSESSDNDIWLPSHPLATTNGIHFPIAEVLMKVKHFKLKGALGRPAPFMSAPSSEEHDALLKYKIFKLDKRANAGETHWCGGGWKNICETAAFLSSRNSSIGDGNRDKQEYEIVPKRLAEAQRATALSGNSVDVDVFADADDDDDDDDEVEIPAWKKSIYGKQMMAVLRTKKRKSLLEKKQKQVKEEHVINLQETTTDSLEGREPSTFHQEIWSWGEVQEEISRTCGEQFVEDAVHETGEVYADYPLNMVQGAVKRLGDIHLWEQGIKGPSEKTTGVLKRTWRERMGEGKRERGKNGINPNEARFSNIVKSETKSDEYFDVDLGSCILEIVGKDGIKKLHAFRSIEVSLFDSEKDI
mmetsp:Transcript_1232/g.1977  ORF Transcript_1232/g.1977 Transcript_1232/m.1977 type:complete len:562 (-) Transcript_1232:780-2465(-)|eukprot:CAMPEP_0196824854 /NCGR_PEP_ID=MMETSP1362-20130617/92726_1 /TAXON_ID=163516 /ORGANISM="Leptocylindrus danicus, Strain CCMP1856" /LENGTH=561 /DNA_ID=CAMNT_0042205207 /DNA_START=24 /DNA_END=1709 /DNA_ORIENTATION=+